jgi:iron complex outermembrane receptor protein
MQKFHRYRLALALVHALACAPAWAGESIASLSAIQEELISLDLASLMEIEISSVAKKPQKIGQSAAAAFVITQEDIRRSGARHLADLLRLAPGLNVARINAHAWAVSARGFNRFYATKLLVLVDGRSVYTPEFSGVYWDAQDLPLSEIERIEVVRGPGGTLWGANAVNGVINIITKHARDTQGGLLVAGSGNAEKAFTELRYGGTLDDKPDVFYRVYAQTGATEAFSDATQPDDWQHRRAGFRLDGGKDAAQWSIQGGGYNLEANETHWESLQPIDANTQGGHLLGHWRKETRQGAEWAARIYYDYNDYDNPSTSFRNDTLDAELRQRFFWNAGHESHWGLGYRWRNSEIPSTASVYYQPQATRRDDLFNLFAQDEIALESNLVLTLGAKLEHNDYSGWEWQPNLRLLWTPGERYSLWASVSRAVRTPARADREVHAEILVPAPSNPFHPVPLVVTGEGRPDTDSETVLAYEIGLRGEIGREFSWDATAFYLDYDKLSLGDQSTSFDFANGHIVFANRFVNGASGRSHGVEVAANWRVREWWSFQLAYSWLRNRINLYPGIVSSYDDLYENQSPRHQVSLRSSLNLPRDWQADAWLRYVDELPAQQMGHIERYLTLDLRLAWAAGKHLEVSLVGQNLLQRQHAEFGADLFNPTFGQVPRGVYGQVRWRF